MIIGQDWGPYSDMKKSNNLLENSKSNWKELIELEKSNTKKLLENYIKESSNGKYSLDDIFITNAIMCARQGNSYGTKCKNTLFVREYFSLHILLAYHKLSQNSVKNAVQLL